MLIVAPKGRTKDVVSFDTFAFFSTHSIVIGKVPAEEAVENAVSIAGAIALKCLTGETRPTNFKSSGKVTNVWSMRARKTVAKKITRGLNAPNPVAVIVFATNPNTPMGANFITNKVICIMVSDMPLQKENIASLWRLGIRIMKKPKSSPNVISPNI